ncbi:FCD domain-containing protein [Streptomyces sp. NBS 14/10]|uniref:FadR/GntR family transcriptional regulator n=1 Tax=Streptomyces sp. NBS 14/10 TaxID=1945643 RepID=UPI000B7C8289|nr:FCD domain-containing protein [Streptomyces sp. NBS 14/10]KAK1178478.1 FCD domain-containing protein [Streptomyces sp. NBS 14/10]
MPLAALRPTPLIDQAAARLREEITGGHWPVGTRLPGETTLAKALGVGRSTVREAVRVLAGAGLVQARQGSGVFVIATEPAEDWPARLRRAAVTDVFEVRMLVEVQAARLAALRRTDADLTTLNAALDARSAAAAGDDAAFVDADIALHAAVVGAAHNPVLIDLFAEFVPRLRQALIDLVDLLALRTGATGTPNPGDEAHTALVRAIERGDADTAGRVLQAELEQTLTRLRDGDGDGDGDGHLD